MTTDQAGFGIASWLPARVQRAMVAEDARERVEDRRAAAEREDRRQAGHDRAMALYRSQAEARGDVVSALALAAGQVTGRTVADVLREAEAVADREDARLVAAERRERGEQPDWLFADPVLPNGPQVSRAGWPQSGYEVDSMVRRAQNLHADLVAAKARRDYPGMVAKAGGWRP